MAAVLCLIFLPLVMAVGFMFGATSGHLSFGTAFAAAVFFAMGSGMLYGLFKMAGIWDRGDEEH